MPSAGRRGAHDGVADLERDPLWAWARSVPKIDLHRHLEGAFRLTTLVEIAKREGIRVPASSVDELRPHVQVLDQAPSFEGFLDKFRLLRRFYVSSDIIQRIAREAVLDAAEEGIVYLELRFNPLALARRQGFAFEEVVRWVVEAVADAEHATGVRTCLILQIPRDESLAVAHEIVEVAIAHFGPWVRGIDLAGNEAVHPPKAFSGPFDRAQQAGLNMTVHAGEGAGAESVRDAVLYLHPQRIGHGIRSIEDPHVIQMLCERGLTLEVCPTSNLHTGVVSSLAEHPLMELLDLGVRATLNTDDPSVSATNLTAECVLAVREMGLTATRVHAMLRQSVEAAFVPPEEKPRLRRQIDQGLQLQ